MQTKFETLNHFYLELINRFFHPKSYFYFCVSSFLQNKTLELKTIDEASFRVISNFIHYLVESPQPALELKEITQIQSFSTLYSDLENHLLKLDLKSLDQSQLKEAIKNYAQFFMSKLVRIVGTEANDRATLEKYLNIKTNLRSMLRKSATKDTDSVPSAAPQLKVYRSTVKAESAAKIDPQSQPESTVAPARKNNAVLNNNILQGFFEEEIFELLKPLSRMTSQPSWFLTHRSDLKMCFESFHNIKEVSMYHGHDEIEAIADRAVKIVKKNLEANQTPDQEAIRLIFDAKTTIEKMVFHHQHVEHIEDQLQKFDSYLSHAGSNVLIAPLEKETQELISKKEQAIPDAEKLSPSESVAPVPAEIDNKEKVNKVTPVTPIVPEDDDIIDKDLLEFKLPGEEDEELLILLQEIIPPAKPFIQKTSHDEIASAEVIHTGAGDTIEAGQSDAEKSDEKPIDESVRNPLDRFHKEASLYHKIILNALAQLTQGKKYQASLEDIELASASLNQLAQKFGLEKMAFLPELMESICFQTNKRNIKLPGNILESMESGMTLLKIFDRNNAEHKVHFISILTTLKEYFNTTFGSPGVRSSKI
ncbi:MAG: hypothetical protein ACOY90_00530 [Candidatus Zhuqueibacterota bacterium]